MITATRVVKAQNITIRVAVMSDIPGILTVHSQHYIAALDQLLTSAQSHSGFLLSPLNAMDLEHALSNSSQFIVLVALDCKDVCGYAFGCDVQQLSPAHQANLLSSAPKLKGFLPKKGVLSSANCQIAAYPLRQ